MKKLFLALVALTATSAAVAYEDRACNGCHTCEVRERPVCEYDIVTTKTKPALKHVEVSYSCPADCRTSQPGKLVERN